MDCHGHAERMAEQRRASSADRGYDSEWRKLRASHLAGSPLCVHCERQGRTTPATVVDHIEPHKGDRAKFTDRANLQSLCARCHNRKTAREDGGYGNRR